MFLFVLSACGSGQPANTNETESGDDAAVSEGDTEAAGPNGDDSENTYPTDPITYQIPFNPGGQSDVEARRQQPYLEQMLGQKVVIQYKPGGGGAVGWTELVNQKPDGYFISGINIPHIILQPLSKEDIGYQTEQIEPIVIMQATPIGLAVPKDSGITSLDQFIQQAKDNPGSVTVAGSGTYTGHHMAHLMLEKLADIKMQYVPFTGAAPAVQAFLGGNTTAMWGNSSDLVKYKDRINILAIGSEKTFKPLPDVPTFKELGYDMTAGIDRGVGAPPGTDPEIIKVLEKAFLDIVKKPEIQEEMYEQGFEPKTMGAEASREYIQSKVADYQDILENLEE
ncbi:MAG: tripartite tricarboxylate transporter substrate binding protein [Bacillaceae bacterium]|nr:tripartite tricarboxylate transporter substrate binding protein [Bacillaceae bacterium]